jgi:DNA (cytosine-5)-methyltransferase 1
VTKPPYRIPPLSEIRELPWNGLNVVSTFSGCGGSSTGYRMSGYRVLAAVEFVPLAQQSYEANMAPYTALVRQDVRELAGADLLKAAGLERGEVDLLDGSPPCEPFSSAGRRDRTWRRVVEYSGQRQRTDDLFFEYARLVDELRPRTFVAENVEGLVRGRAKGYFLWILDRLRGLGYRVQARVLDAAWLGVPQSRRRVIFVGVREDLGRDPAFPDPLPYQYTVRDALPHVDRHGACVNFDVWKDMGRDPARTMRDSARHPCGTIVSQGPHQGTGYVETADGQRTFTIPELLRICGFPDDYRLAGSFAKQWERLGDCVAPPMAAAVSATIRDQILKET